MSNIDVIIEFTCVSQFLHYNNDLEIVTKQAFYEKNF